MKNVYFNLNQMQHPCRRTMVGWTGTPSENREMIEPRECGLTHDHHGTISYAQPNHTPTQSGRESAARVAKYVAMIFAVLTLSIGQVWATSATVGITTTTSTTSGATGTARTISGAANLTVTHQLNSGTSGALAEYSKGDKQMYYASNSAVYTKGAYKWNVNTSATEIITANNYVGYDVAVASGYKYSLSNLTFQIGASCNMTYKLMIYNSSGTAIYTGSETTVTNYSKTTSTNYSQSIDLSGTAAVQNLTGTFYVRAFLKFNSTGKYLYFPAFTITGEVEEAAVVTKKIYLKNSMGWASAHVTLLGTSSYWDATNGSGSYGKTTYTMSYDSGKKLFYVDVPSASNDTYLCFTKDKQENYGNFYNTEAVYVNGGYEFGKVGWVNTANTITKNGTKYYGNSDLSGVQKEGYSEDVYLVGDFNEWAKSAATAFDEDGGTFTKEVTLTANTHYKFKVIDNAWFGNDGGIVHSQSDWGFTQSAGDCNFVTGPEGTYTITYNRSTNQVSVAYPEVSHPNEFYTYFQKPEGWESCYAHLFTGGTSMVSWHGAPMSATTTICETVYYYAAIVQSDFTTVIFNDGGSTQTADWTVAGSGNKHRTYGEADWQPFSTYTITFDGNGNTDGTMSDVNGICPSGSTTLEANTFTKSGYDFRGWKTDVAVTANGSAVAKDGTVEDASELTGITSDITLTAIWTPATYTITLAKGDHGAANQEATVAYNATSLTSITHVIANTGYELTGYYDGETKVLNTDGTFAGTTISGYITDSKWTKTSNCELTAKWTAQSYTLTWDLDGGTVTVAGTGAAVDATGTPSSSVQFGSAIIAPTVVKDGYAFNGWNTTPATNMPAENTTYTAQWGEAFTLSFNTVGGSLVDPLIVAASTAIEAPSNPTRLNYTFLGWKDENGDDFGSTQFAAGITGDVTLIAQWSRNSISGGPTVCTYIADDEHDAEIESDNSYEAAAFSLKKIDDGSWTIAADKSTANSSDSKSFAYAFLPGNTSNDSQGFQLTATKAISSLVVYYTMTDSKFTTDDQSKSGTFTYKINTADAVASTNTDKKSNKTAYIETISSISKDDVVKLYSSTSRLAIFGIYATYVGDPITITFKVQGSTYASITATSGETLGNLFLNNALPTPEVLKGTFTGWTYSGTPVSASTVISGSMEIDANIEMEVYDITLLRGINGSSDGEATVELEASSLDISTAPTAPSNYRLKGYYTADSDGDKIAEADGTLVEGNVTGYITSGKWSREEDTDLYAQWDPVYSITKLTAVNGTITVDKTEAVAGETITLSASPNYRYLFGSWTVTKEDGSASGVTVTNNQFTMPSFGVKVNATFVADERKYILYVTTAATTDDKIYETLNGVDDYNVIVATPGTQTPTDYDLIVFHESIGGAKAAETGNIAKTAITSNVPILNMKSFFYGSDRWNWGTANAGQPVTGATLNDAYCNIKDHPLFGDVAETDGFMTLFTSATGKAMQPLGSLTKTGYTLATTPNATSGNGCAIHEVTPSERGVASAKYLMISVGNENGTYKLLTAAGQQLFRNAAAYLLDGEASWTPENAFTITTTLTNATSDASNYVCPENIVGDFIVTITPSVACSMPTEVAVAVGGSPLTEGEDYTWNQTTGTLAIPTATITGNVTITATGTHFTVTYKAGEGTGDNVVDNTNATVQGKPVGFTAPDGKVFAGWKNESTNANVKVGADITKDLTLVAVWVEEYTVTYNANGGTGDNVEKENELEIAENTFTAPTGKLFKYWNTAADASGVTYRPGDNYEALATVTLYAIWQSIPAAIFVWTKGDGASISVDNTDLSEASMGSLTTGTSIVARKLGDNNIDNNKAGYKLANNDVCVEIELTSGFKVGDTIKITGTGGGNGDRAFAIAPTTTINAVTDTILTEIIAGNAEHVYTAVVKSKQAGTKIRIFRMAGKTMYLKGITITRPIYKYLPSGTAEWPTSTGWQEGGASASAPTLSDIVIVDHNITVPDGVTAKAEHIILENNSTLTIAATGALILKEAFTREDGTAPTASDLVLESTSDGNSTLIFDNSNFAAATVQMYSKAKAEGGWTWQYIAAPAAVSALDNYYGGYLYKWVESSWAAVGRDATMELFAGYCVSYPTAGHTFAIAGELAPTTSKSITVPAGKSMVIGNSWTAPIQISQMTAEDFTNVDQTVYLYNTGNDESGEAGTYKEDRYAAGTYVPVPINATASVGVTKVSSLQGFFVKNNSDLDGTLSLSYSKHVRPSGGNSVVNGAMHAPKRVADETDRPVVLKMKVSGSQYDDRLILLEREDFTTGYDAGWDGDKMGDVATSPRITTTREDGTADAVAALPDLEGTLINFRAASTDDQYTLYFDYETEDAEPLYLLDLTNNAYTRVETGSSYTFFTTDKADHKRFALTRYRAPQITTGVEDTLEDNGQGKAVKFIENDKLYILRNGVLYDGTGKKVIEN